MTILRNISATHILAFLIFIAITTTPSTIYMDVSKPETVTHVGSQEGKYWHEWCYSQFADGSRTSMDKRLVSYEQLQKDELELWC